MTAVCFAQTLSSPRFRAPSFPSHAIPNGIAAIDVDVDGHLDVVVATESFGIEWMKGNGGGLLDTAQPIVTEAGYTRIATGPINHVAPHDWVAINRNAKSFRVVLASGGAFTVLPSISLGASPSDLELVDFTGDGKLDLVVTTDANPNTRWFIGDGLGAFSASGSFHTGGFANGIAAGDFDSDGDSDLLVASTQVTVTPLRNDGGGVFTALPSVSTTAIPFGVEATDLDGNGTLDFLTVDSNSKSLRTFSGNGLGSFTPALAFHFDGGAVLPLVIPVAALKLHDINRDGNLDVTIASVAMSNFSWLGNGKGSFAPKPIRTTLAEGSLDLAYADLDEDGVDDLVLSAASSSSIAVGLGSGTGEFGHFPLTTATCVDSATLDANDDGNFDLVTAHDADSLPLVVRLGNGLGDFIQSTSNGLTAIPRRVLAGDLNGDAIEDIVALPGQSGTFFTLQGIPGGTFGPSNPANSGAGYQGHSAELVDLDLDGDLDLIGVTGSGINFQYQLQLGTGTGNFAMPSAFASAPSSNADAWSAIEDMNADGFPDFVYTRPGGFEIRLSGPGGAALATHTMPTHFIPAGILVADLDGDSQLDVATGQSNTANDIVIYHGFGDGTISPAIPVPVPSSFSTEQVTGADFDGDLDIDLLVQNNNYESAILTNLGSGQFSLESRLRIPKRLNIDEPPIEFIDFDHDSDLDMLAVDYVLVAIPQNGPHDPCAGSFAPAGAGCPGSGGFTPHLTALGCPSPGKTVKLAVSQGLGGSVALLVFGAQPAAIPIGGGCQLHAFPLAPIVIPIPLSGSGPGGGSITIGGTIPAGAGTLSVVTQFFTVDPGVALGYAGSNAVQINQQ